MNMHQDGSTNRSGIIASCRALARVTVLTVTILASANTAVAQECESTPLTVGYRTFSYDNSGLSGHPTESKPESKLWYHDGSWWGILWDPDLEIHRIHKFDAANQCWTSVGGNIDSRPQSSADVLWSDESQKLYVSSRAKESHSGNSDTYFLRFSYNSSTKTYSLNSGFPAVIQEGRVEALTIARDGTGQMWAVWEDGQEIMINRTTGSDSDWGTPFQLPVQGGDVSSDDIAAIIAFDGDKIGVMWSNQQDKRMYFAVHLDSKNDTSWEPRENALADVTLGRVADDHINLALACASGGSTLLAATKTSLSGADAPMIFLLKRAPGGTWSRHIFGLGAQLHTRPIVLVNADTDSVYVIAKAKTNPIRIYMKRTHVDNPSFVPGLGEQFIVSKDDDNINDPTSTKQCLTEQSNLLVLASDKTSKNYVHNYVNLGGSLPIISSFTPTSGPAGSKVTITGSRFTGTTSVAFNGTAATSFTVVSDTQIRATVPQGATTGPISVENASGDKHSATDFTVIHVPVVSSFNPVSSPVGTEVTIAGSDYLQVSDVLFDGVSAPGFTVDSETQIRVNVPNNATTGPLAVVNPAGTGVSGNSFTVTETPHIASFSPSSAAAGTEVTCLGNNFTDAISVSFNGTSTSTFTVDDDDEIRATVPAGATTGRITVTNVNGYGQSSDDLTVVHPPTISSFTPETGYAGLAITIEGTNFVEVSDVSFNSIPASSFTVESETVIRAIVPVNATEGPIQLTNLAGIATSSASLAIITAPVVTTLNPTDDAFVRESEADTNFGSSNSLRVRETGSGVEHNSYLKFTVSGMSGTVNSVTLRLLVTDAATDGGQLYQASNDYSTSSIPWDEDGITWNNAPAFIGPSLAAVGTVGVDDTIELDVTSVVQADGIYSFVLSNDENDAAWYSSREGTWAPQLVISVFEGTAPVISSFSPTSGLVGSEVTLNGTHFSGATAVAFGGMPSTSFSTDSDTQIRATVPSGAATGKLSVTSPDGTGMSLDNFTVIQPPTVSSFSPVSGSAGTQVTITGTNLSIVSVVNFNGTAAASFTIDSESQLRAEVALGATTGAISVTNPAGVGNSPTNFTVLFVPAITSFSPSEGTAGTQVTLVGGNFTGTTEVSFAGISAVTFTVDSDSQIRATVPVGASTGPITVTNGDGSGVSSDDFTVVLPPGITSFTPDIGPPGTEVTILGSSFLGTTDVSFNLTPATGFSVDSDTQIRATVPSAATTGTISVTNDAGTSSSGTPFTVTEAPSTFTFNPTDDAFTNSSNAGKNYGASSELRLRMTSSSDVDIFLKFDVTGLPGSVTSATLKLMPYDATDEGGDIHVASNFYDGTSNPWDELGLTTNNAPSITGSPLSSVGETAVGEIVEFDVTSAITGNGTYSFCITNSSTDAGKYYSKEGPDAPVLEIEVLQSPLPQVSSFTPTSGVADDEVTIFGNNFDSTTNVAFNGLPASSFSIDSNTQLRATVPQGATTGAISVTNVHGSDTSSGNFVVLAPPTVTSFAPGSGPVGEEVTVTGTSFTTATNVDFNGISAAVVTIDSDTQLRAQVPSGATTGPIAVTNNVGTASSASNFTVLNPPTITSFSPTSGPIGTEVTVLGTHLSDVTDASINGISVSVLEIDSDSQLRVEIPSGATTGLIGVTSGEGNASSAEPFVVLGPPTVSSFTPSSGPPGTEVTLTGLQFSNATDVAFNAVSASLFTVDSDTQLRVTVPFSATTGLISVANSEGTANSQTSFVVTDTPSSFTFHPSDDAFTNSSSPSKNYGATGELRIRETSSATCWGYLKFNVTGLSGAVTNATLRLVAYDASDDGGELFVVSNNYNSSTDPWNELQMTHNNAPEIISGPLGSVSAVGVGEATQLDVSSVVTGDGIYSFVLANQSTDAAKYYTKEGSVVPELVVELLSSPVPKVTAFSPASGVAGTEVTIAGLNFVGTTNASFDGTSAAVFFVDSDKQLRAEVPAGASTGKISVTNADGTAQSVDDFIVIQLPVISAIDPMAGPVGTEVTVTGTSFSAATDVRFAGISASGFIVDSDTQLHAAVPSGATTGPVTISNVAGSGNSPSDFTVTFVPAVTSFSPSNGVSGTQVTISGANFTGTTDVLFNGTAAASFTIGSDTGLLAQVPTGATSGPINVTNADGTGSSAASFIVIEAPSIATFTPVTGPVGTEVTISGANFIEVSGVALNGTDAPSFTVDSAIRIRANVPGGATTGAITVTNAAGTGVSASDFTVSQPSGSLTFNPTDDAYVITGNPLGNYNGNTLRVRETGSSNFDSYLKFNVSGLSGAAGSAVLRLYCLDGGPAGGSVYSVSNNLADSGTPWTEAELTAANAPVIPDPAQALSTTAAVSTNTFVDFDVSGAVTSNGVFSFAIRNGNSDVVWYSSKEGSTVPELIVETSVTARVADSAPEMTHLSEIRLENEAEETIPEIVRLLPNYPNPFNIETTIEYTLPQQARVQVFVFNLKGQLVRPLVDEVQSTGFKKIKWNGRNASGSEVGSGMYIIRLKVGDQVSLRKITLQK